MKEGGEERLKSTIYESTLSTAPRSPFPDGEGKLVAATPLFYWAMPESGILVTSHKPLVTSPQLLTPPLYHI